MMHTPAHLNTKHPAGQVAGNIGGELKLGTLRPGEADIVDQFIPDPFSATPCELPVVQSPEFYMAKIADTLADMETLMVHMLGLMRGDK